MGGDRCCLERDDSLEKLEELGIQVPEKLRSTPLGIAAFIFSRDSMIALPNNLEGKNIDRNKIVSQLQAQADDEKAKKLIGVFQNDSEGKFGAPLGIADRFAAKNGLDAGEIAGFQKTLKEKQEESETEKARLEQEQGKFSQLEQSVRNFWNNDTVRAMEEDLNRARRDFRESLNFRDTV